MKKSIKLLIALSICVALIVGLLPVYSGAVDNKSFAGGDGSEENPYQVSTPAQLNEVRNDLSAHYVQINDIDMSSWGNWEPIGKAIPIATVLFGNDSENQISELFDGTYDGRQFKISNLSILDNSVHPSSDCFGLFAGTENGEISNINLDNVNITIDKNSTDYISLINSEGTSYCVTVGGIVGVQYKMATIENCTVSGSISVVNCEDALVGGIAGEGFPCNCVNYADISVKSKDVYSDSTIGCGGITGESTSINSTISYCKNYGNIDATAGSFAHSGGISGEYGLIDHCINYGEIHAVSAYGGNCSFAGSSNAGGIVGSNSSDNISHCINYGNVNSVTYDYNWYVQSYAGGIVGFCGYYGSGCVSNCYNCCESIVSKHELSEEDRSLIDGACGRIAGYSILTKNSYSVNYTKINGRIPTEEIGSDKINGESLSAQEIEIEIQYILNGIDAHTITDNDADGIPDEWEINGADIDGDGITDVDLPAMGADPNKPDVFVELDWLAGRKPNEEAMKMVFEQFKYHGINIHLDLGPDSVDYVTGKRWGSLSGGNQLDLSANDIESMVGFSLDQVFPLGINYENWSRVAEYNFTPVRLPVFRYCMFVNRYYHPEIGSGSSGIANDIPGQFFIIADVDGWILSTDTATAGTFMHELGHTLGLCHGGNEHINGKPNYLSVMNYLFQTTGLVGTGEINYSDFVLPALNEYSIDESKGIDPEGVTSGSGIGTAWVFQKKMMFYAMKSDGKIEDVAGKGIDFNQNGKIEANVKINLNGSKDSSGNDTYEVYHASINDWDALNFKGNYLGKMPEQGIAISIPKSDIKEIYEEFTIEEAEELGVLFNIRIQGDIDGNGQVENSDLVTIARYIVGLTEGDTKSAVEAYADMNSDGKVDNADIVTVARIIVGLA